MRIKILTKAWGKINPLKIEDYIESAGYSALRKFIFEMSPEKAIAQLKLSRLSGRGGAGFLTGEKWEVVSKKKGEKFFICNLDESEPGTYKDRLICDNNPHMLLEGIIIGALSIGAKKAYIYINGHYKKQAEILEKALLESVKEKYLGQNILGSDYELEIEIFRGAGAYICGEETALINSMEGKRGEPKNRPPYPVEHGFLGKPTVVNNAETLANVPWIISNGGASYCEIGSSLSPGTKLFLLDGAIKNKGCFEAPTGISIRELIEDFGGGIENGKDFWFAQIGGACGKLVLENELGQRLEFGKECACPMGSGSVLVMDKTINLYDVLLSWSGFFRRESCGKCAPCREGTFRMHEIIKRLRDGKISERDKTALEDILWTLENTTFCPFGRFAATAMRSAFQKLEVYQKI